MNRRRQTSRRVALGVAILLAIPFGRWLYHSVQQAREAARRVADKSHLYQHSGSHPGISVNIDDTGTIVSIGICPTCFEENSPVIYYLGHERIDPPEELIREACKRIKEKLTDPTFMHQRDRWNRLQYTLAPTSDPSAELD